MGRPVTLFTGQWADLPLAVLSEKAAAWGYDGLELACWGDHLDVARGAVDREYCARPRGFLEKHGLRLLRSVIILPGSWCATQTLTAVQTASPRRHARGMLKRSVRGPWRQ